MANYCNGMPMNDSGEPKRSSGMSINYSVVSKNSSGMSENDSGICRYGSCMILVKRIMQAFYFCGCSGSLKHIQTFVLKPTTVFFLQR